MVLFYLFKPSGQWDDTFNQCILLSHYTATCNDLINEAAQRRHSLPSEEPRGAKENRSGLMPLGTAEREHGGTNGAPRCRYSVRAAIESHLSGQ